MMNARPTPEAIDGEVPVIDEPGIYPDLLNAHYHVQKGLSSSGAKTLVPPSAPALFKWEQDHPVYKDIYDFGSLAHKIVLADEKEVLVVVNAEDWRTKDARAARDAARAEGLIPCLQKEVTVVRAMAKALRAHPIASALLRAGTGTVEPSLFARDASTGVLLRCRPDWLPHVVPDRRMILCDYKTAANADRESFAKSVVNFGYHQQAPWYIDIVKALGLDDDPAFVFIVQEKAAPYLVSVFELDVNAITTGRRLNRIAIDRYAHCVATDTWPGYADDVELLSLPIWYERQVEDLVE